MSDKMLMENWRKYLVEKEVLEEGPWDKPFPKQQPVPTRHSALSRADKEAEQALRRRDFTRGIDWSRAEAVIPEVTELAQSIEKIITTFREMENKSDKLIKKLENVPFWKEVFTVEMFEWNKKEEEEPTSRISETTLDEAGRHGTRGGIKRYFQSAPEAPEEGRGTIEGIVKYYLSLPNDNPNRIEGSETEWITIANFVGSCFLSNHDETIREMAEEAASQVGETSKSSGFKGKIKGGIAGSAAGAAGGHVVGGPPGAVVGGLIGLFAVPMMGILETYVKKNDYKKFIIPALSQLNINTKMKNTIINNVGEKWDERIADLVMLAFHRLEYQILRQLDQKPLVLPEFDMNSIGAEFEKDYKSLGQEEATTQYATGGIFEPSPEEETTPEEPEEEAARQKAEEEAQARAQDAADTDAEWEEYRRKHMPAKESKFHDNWRNFLLTEEKL